MKSIKYLSKTIVERIAGNAVWLEHPSSVEDVRALVEKCRPVAIEQPLARAGKEGDGGYLVPDDLEGIRAAISPGVSDTVDFDLWLADRGVDVYMADASVDGPPIANSRFHFSKKFIDVFDDPTNIRLDSLCAKILPKDQGDLILQMDIEGAEHRVLLDVSDELMQRFRIILVELHQLDRLFSNFGFEPIKATLEKLLRHHNIVHIHPNNVVPATRRGDLEIPPVMEFTFYRKDRATCLRDKKLVFPHPLDRDIVIDLPHLALPSCWWRESL